MQPESAELELTPRRRERPWYESMFGSFCSMCRRDEAFDLHRDSEQAKLSPLHVDPARRKTETFSPSSSNLLARSPANSAQISRNGSLVLPANLPDPAEAKDALSKRKAIIARSEAIINAIRSTPPNSGTPSPASGVHK